MPYNQGMIGNAADAALALSRWESHDFTDILSLNGNHRAVYLINGVVYKIDHSHTNDGNNVAEYNTIRDTWHNLPTGVFFPATGLFTVSDRFGDDRFVIGQEFVTGQSVYACPCEALGTECDEFCMPESVFELVQPHMWDCFGFNVILRDDSIFIIDPC